MQVIFIRKLGNNYDDMYDTQLTQFIINCIMYMSPHQFNNLNGVTHLFYIYISKLQKIDESGDFNLICFHGFVSLSASREYDTPVHVGSRPICTSKRQHSESYICNLSNKDMLHMLYIVFLILLDASAYWNILYKNIMKNIFLYTHYYWVINMQCLSGWL